MENDLFSILPPTEPDLPPPHKFSRRKILLIAGFSLGGLIVILIISLVGHKPQSTASQLAKDNTSNTTSQSKKSTSTSNTTNSSKPPTSPSKTAPSASAPVPPTVSIDYVTIQTGVTENNNTEGDYAATAAGHYAYIDGSTSDGDLDGAQGGKVIYDGRVVYQGADLVQDNVVISRNGLHYAYYRDDGTNYDIYVDNKLVNNNIPDSDTFVLDGVSNDGLHYVYDINDPNTSSNDSLYKDLSTGAFYSPNGIFDAPKGAYSSAFFSSDLSHYVGFYTPNGNGSDDSASTIVANGSVTNQFFSGDPQMIGISENGSHYYAVTENDDVGASTYQLVVDGKTITSLDNSNYAGVNNGGEYFYIDNSTPAFVIGSKTIPLPSDNFNGNEIGYEYAAINSDGSHYVVGDSDKSYWLADGNQISVTGDVYNVELDGTTLYIYRWSN
jgi:hypothetical protein